MDQLSDYLEKKINRKFFDGRQWWFSVIDVIEFFTGSKKPRDVWYKLKKKELERGYIDLADLCINEYYKSKDGVERKIDFISRRYIFYLIHAIDSPSAHRIIVTLATIGSEKMIEDSENKIRHSQLMDNLFLKFTSYGRIGKTLFQHPKLLRVYLYIIINRDDLPFIEDVEQYKINIGRLHSECIKISNDLDYVFGNKRIKYKPDEIREMIHILRSDGFISDNGDILDKEDKFDRYFKKVFPTNSTNDVLFNDDVSLRMLLYILKEVYLADKEINHGEDRDLIGQVDLRSSKISNETAYISKDKLSKTAYSTIRDKIKRLVEQKIIQVDIDVNSSYITLVGYDEV